MKEFIYETGEEKAYVSMDDASSAAKFLSEEARKSGMSSFVFMAAIQVISEHMKKKYDYFRVASEKFETHDSSKEYSKEELMDKIYRLAAQLLEMAQASNVHPDIFFGSCLYLSSQYAAFLPTTEKKETH
jgi:hypothetical protein